MFYAGFSRVDVTPPLGSPVAGYYRKRIAKGILDPIQLNALALNDGENTVIMITGDFVNIVEVIATKLRSEISEVTGVPADNIMISALHQHTSVRISPPINSPSDMTDEAYLDILHRKFCDVAKMAVDDLKEATVYTGEKETATPISFIRRYRMKDGSTRTNPGYLNPDVDYPLGEADNTVRVIRFKRKDANDIAYVNFSTHPDVVGGELFSADWPGFVRRFTEAELENVSCIFFTGAQGDTNHHNVFKEKFTCERYEYAEFMGRVITDAVKEIWDNAVCRNVFRLRSQIEKIYVLSNTSGIEKMEWAKQYCADYHAGKIDTKGQLNVIGEASRISRLHEETLFKYVPVTVIGMGDVAFVGFGCEPFTQYAKEARSFAPDTFVVCSCCSNGGQGYIPTEQAYSEGGYEALSSKFSPDIAPKLKQTVKSMLDGYAEYKNS